MLPPVSDVPTNKIAVLFWLSVIVNVHVPPVAPAVTVRTAPGPDPVVEPAKVAVAGDVPEAAPVAFVQLDATVYDPV